jgi:hypothetical protein
MLLLEMLGPEADCQAEMPLRAARLAAAALKFASEKSSFICD